MTVQPLWQPSLARRENSLMQQFQNHVSKKTGVAHSDYWSLYRWSVAEPARFWETVAEYCDVRWQKKPNQILVNEKTMRASRWFVGGELNFAENLLPPAGDETAIISVAEGRGTPRFISRRELRNEVARCRGALEKVGVGKGDRVAGMIANCPEAVVAMLATASLGAIWSSCSPDFGVNGIVDRFGQVEPKVVFFTTGYHYNGKAFSCASTIRGCLERLPSVKTAVGVPLVDGFDTAGLPSFREFLHTSGLSSSNEKDLPLTFTPTAFEHPLYIMFSSGTTGVPKCIVHGAGGTLLQHKKELMLHSDIKPGDRLLYFTTCGWMMWNWMVSALSTGATLVLFEGSVSYPDFSVLWRAVSDHKVTHFGTSPKFLSACMKAAYEPSDLTLSSLRAVLSTGSPLLPEHFTWVYEHVGKDVHLASISGGTDIISCFMLGVPTLPVYSGEIQAPGLGMAIAAWNDDAEPVVGEKGELVCTQPFVSMPVGFWNDQDGKRYQKAYFDFYPDRDVWRHGDFIAITERGGVIVFGRSDATLNPGGVRIGTAEIYRQVEAMPGVIDSLAIGHEESDGDVSIWLFVKLGPEMTLTDTMIKDIKTHIREELTPRHVPARIFAVKDIPYTRSGKKVELAVKQAVHGETVENLGALVNPEAMSEYFALSKT